MMVTNPCVLVAPPVCAPRTVTFAYCCATPLSSMTLTVRVPVSAKADPVKHAIARNATAIHVGGITGSWTPRRDVWLGMVRGAPFLENGSVTIWLLLCRFE